ncbi:MAG: type II and III secretion system protein family protein [Propionivibrio sp.]|nr:type II and III secretion system protein family protein [Propionivibrio sp.]
MKSAELNENRQNWRMALNALKRYVDHSGCRLVKQAAFPIVFIMQLGTGLAYAELVEVEAGSQQTIKLEQAARRVAIGNEEIARVKLLNKQELLLQGVKPGATSLLVWAKGSVTPLSYRISVRKAAEGALLKEFSGLRLKASSDLLLLSGTSENMARHVAAREIARHADGDGKGTLLDAAQLPYNGEVQVEVRVVELSRRVLKRAGLNLFSNTSGFSFGTFAPSSLSKVQLANDAISTESSLPVSQALNLVMGAASEGVVGVLSMLEGNGFARTLAQPVLVAQSGQTASFLAGGEFPVPVPQALGQTTIQFKPYGIRLDVSPTVLSENRIAVKIAPEVSDLNFDNAVTINGVSVPSLSTRRADTSIELGNGESFVIGGLVSQSIVKNLDKIPGLGDIPILGMFFKSARLTREDKELLIIVTPRLVRPLAANSPLGALPGAELADYNPSLWDMLISSDKDEAARFTGLSR